MKVTSYELPDTSYELPVTSEQEGLEKEIKFVFYSKQDLEIIYNGGLTPVSPKKVNARKTKGKQQQDFLLEAQSISPKAASMPPETNARYLEQYWQQENIPYTRPRIEAFIKNPHAESEDILLVAAYDHSRLISYFGLIPELIQINTKPENTDQQDIFEESEPNNDASASTPEYLQNSESCMRPEENNSQFSILNSQFPHNSQFSILNSQFPHNSQFSILNSQLKKVFWLTSWWTDPAYRGLGIGSAVFKQAIQTGVHIITSSAHIYSNRLMKQDSGFKIYTLRDRTYFFFNLNRKILSENNRFKGIIRYGFGLLHLILGLASSIRISKWLNHNPEWKALQIEYIQEPDAETMQFLEPLLKGDLTLKTREYLSWRCNLPFYKTRFAKLEEKYKTYFGKPGHRIESTQAKLWQDERIIAFLCMQIIDNVLCLPYLYFQPGTEMLIASFIGKLICDQRFEVLYTHNPRIIDLIKSNRIPYLFCKVQAVEALQTPNLSIPPGLLIQDGDGGI